MTCIKPALLNALDSPTVWSYKSFSCRSCKPRSFLRL